MSRVGLAATSGWGKSYNCQLWLEKNLPEMDYAAVLDYKDEYRGLVEGVEPSNPHTDLCKWHIAGPREVDKPVSWWVALLERYERVIIARYRIDGEDWRQVCGRVAAAMRRLFEENPGSKSLLGFDEAHVVAPQRGSYPEAIKKSAKVGRGEGLATLWVSQELQDMDNRVIGMWTDTILGGFKTEAALSPINVEYPVEIHNANISADAVPRLPDELRADGDDLPLRKFEDDSGSIVGSEWVEATGAGDYRRVDTRDVVMHSEHYGSEGQDLESPYA